MPSIPSTTASHLESIPIPTAKIITLISEACLLLSNVHAAVEASSSPTLIHRERLVLQ